MADKDVEVDDTASRPLPRLPNELLVTLAKYFTPQSSMALALSGECEGFDIVLGLSREHVISQCFFLTPNSWSMFFRQHILPLSVTVFDVSHTYWFEPQVLLDGILQMTNLKDLSINDSKLNLSHLLQIFKVLKQITKLSFTLVEGTLEEFQDKPQRVTRSRSGQTSNESVMKQGFQKLTHLKLFTFVLNDRFYIDYWPVTLGVLGWCRDCINLLIEVTYTRDFLLYGIGYEPDHNEEVIQLAREKFFPHLGWMTFLESLVFIKRGYTSGVSDAIVSELVNWIFTQQERVPDSLQRLWIQEGSVVHDLYSPTMTSLCKDYYGELDLNHERYRSLQHLSGIIFRRKDFAHLQNLKYARGYCIDDAEGLGLFCQEHPLLEYLHFDVHGIVELRGDWTLLHLKTLVYGCDSPSKEIVDRLMDYCPNIESLHIGHAGSTSYCSDEAEFLSAIRFSRLTWLSLSGFELFSGSFLSSIVKQCPNLETLHISKTEFSRNIFLRTLSKCIPVAVKLRDLRLEWVKGHEDESTVLLLLKSLLKCSSHLERLVLSGETVIRSRGDWIRPSETADVIFEFISKMVHLRALCLAVFGLDPVLIEEVKRRVVQEILPVRPSFWLHLGHDLPKENDPTAVPRIHYDQIVNPIPFYDAPPAF